MKGSRSNLTLVLALVLAATAAVSVYYYSSSTKSGAATPVATQAPTPTEVPKVGVLFTTRDVEADTVVTADMVEVRQVLPEDKNARALTSAEEAVGKVTTASLVAGEQILNSRLAAEPLGAEKSGTFAFEVPTGKRALALTFDEVVGAGSLVQPGDHVDVIAYFEIDVKDPQFEQANNLPGAVSEDDTDDDGDEDNDDNNDEDDVDYTQYVTSYIVQDVEVLFVAQAVSPEENGVAGPNAEPTPTPTVAPTVTADSTATVPPTPEKAGDPVARPTAISVTLAVNPEQAQRLLLAAETVYHANDKAALRLSLRAPGDTSTVALRPAQMGNIPLGELLGDVNRPMVPSELAITEAEFTRRTLTAGELLDFRVTIKNISDNTIKSARQAPPEFSYTEGTAYDELGFTAEPGTYRLGLNVSGAYPTEYPYRWSFGRDLKPGESIEVVGSVKMTESAPSAEYWFGIILEPDMVTQDGVSVTDITVLPVTAAVVRDETTPLRTEATIGSTVVKDLKAGDKLDVLESNGDWFRVQTADKSEGWVAVADLEVVSAQDQDGTPTATPQATPQD